MAPGAALDLGCKTLKSQECEKRNVIWDMGGVLFKYDGGAAGIAGLVNPKLFNHMLQDSIWNAYETEKITTEEAYDQLSQKYGVPAENIRAAATVAIEGFAPVPDIMEVVNEYRGRVRHFCMTNVPTKEFEYVHNKFPEVWQIFEKIFTSASVGLRKPNLQFFQHVLKEAGLNPAETVFVDDSFQNCVAAKSLGITVVLCENIGSAVQQLNFLLRNEEERLEATRKYLDRVLVHDRQDLETVSNKGARLTDNFSEFYIAEVLNDARFLPDLSIPENGEYCYTRDTDMTVYKWILHPLPNDLDTTSVGTAVLYANKKISLKYVNTVVDHMLTFASEDGILQTYFDRSRPRTCHVVLANITKLFHVAGRRLPEPSAEFLYNVLLTKAYVDGSQYYIGPATFLYFLSRTAAEFRDNHFLNSDFIPLLTLRVQETMGTLTENLDVAMIILACLNLRIEPDVRDVERLERAQNVDGSWDMTYWFKANVLSFGCKGLTSAFGLSALQRVKELNESRKN